MQSVEPVTDRRTMIILIITSAIQLALVIFVIWMTLRLVKVIQLLKINILQLQNPDKTDPDRLKPAESYVTDDEFQLEREDKEAFNK